MGGRSIFNGGGCRAQRLDCFPGGERGDFEKVRGHVSPAIMVGRPCYFTHEPLMYCQNQDN